MEQTIPDDIIQMADWLSYSFSRSMHSPTDSKEDLKQDLLLRYLERKSEGFDFNSKDGWFIDFKNYLLNKYRVLKGRKDIMSKYIQEQTANQG